MSDAAADRLVRLLPVAAQMDDAEQGGPLAALLRVIGEQVEVIDEDIAQLYENWFIETCQEWVVPYLGDLVGYETAGSAPRRDVANTIAARRRKGTLALLEELARDAAGWPARAVESYRLLAVAQSLNHLRLDRGRTLDLRGGDALDRLDGPFDDAAHVAGVARITSRRRRGRHGIPSAALYAWRLKPYSVTHGNAFSIDRARGHYTFSVLTNDAPIMTRPVDEPSPSHVAEDVNVPAWIRRRAFAERTADYYGGGKSIRIWRDRPDNPVPLADVVAADLSEWACRPRGGKVAIDPVRGRIAFDPDDAPRAGVWVTYHYGFSDDMGGGEYPRPLAPPGARRVYRIGPGMELESIMDAVRRWRGERDAGESASAIIELTDSGVYQDHEPIDIDLGWSERLEIRAAHGTRPVVRLLDLFSNRPDALRIRGPKRPDVDRAAEAPRVTLDGLLVVGRSVELSGCMSCVSIRHTTLVPGWSLESDCEPRSEEPSLVFDDLCGGRVEIDHSIVGGIRVAANEVWSDPVPVAVSDSILDATDRDAQALGGHDGRRAHVAASFTRATVIGQVAVHAIPLAQDSIFDGEVNVARRQSGCIRFSSVPDGSRTPARYNCQPDLARRAVREAFGRGELTAAERDRALEREATRVRPLFRSTRYGRPEYCQLDEACAAEIRAGAEDESEMGAFHDVCQPQREANLRARLDEFSPADRQAGIIFVT